MAKDWFECKVRYDKTLETGLLKKVTESYLVDALSFTEAEERFLQEIEPMMSGEYSVSDIKRAKIAELFESIDTTDDKCSLYRIRRKEGRGEAHQPDNAHPGQRPARSCAESGQGYARYNGRLGHHLYRRNAYHGHLQVHGRWKSKQFRR